MRAGGHALRRGRHAPAELGGQAGAGAAGALRGGGARLLAPLEGL